MNQDIARRRILIIEDTQVENSAVLRRADTALSAELKDHGVEVLLAESYGEALPILGSDTALDAILLAVDMERREESGAGKLLHLARKRQPDVPVFLLADRDKTARAISPELLADADEFIWIFEDSPAFIAGRIESAMERYRTGLLPPLMRAVWEYNEHHHEYSWAAPGHQGGRGFTKSPAGRKFYDFYGENLFRTDTGIERSSIGSLLDHTGAFGECERRAAKIFGAHESYSGVAGTSGSNRTVMQACLAPGDIAICDRNCHKSIEQGLILTGAVPVYLLPTRNRYGIIGPILPSEMSPETIRGKIRSCRLHHPGDERSYAVVTNCTYDGLCYQAARAEELLTSSADRIHFDEAWYAYARFHPVYRNHYAMRGKPDAHKGATVFATHSTHKLLSALSQASFIHVRYGRKPVHFDRMNQAYMMHTTTSPLYAICASNDIAAKMMADNGETLIQEVIEEAVDFRQALARLHRSFTDTGSWFFQVWNAPEVRDPHTGKSCAFADAPRHLLTRDQSFWRLRPGEIWHGFDGLPDENCVMLDPVKVSILAPGMGDDGKMLPCGIPAMLAGRFLYRAGIVPTRITDFQLMFLFSIGITKGKWVTLLNALLNFKKLYDSNAPLEEALPELVQQYPERYGKTGLRELGNEMFCYLQENRPGDKLNAAFASLPEQALTPRDAYMKIVRNEVELVPAEKLPNRISANSIIPYPPGIPMLMSGERFGGEGSAQIAYLQALAAWDAEFPGFEHETEGSTSIRGVYHVMCVRE